MMFSISSDSTNPLGTTTKLTTRRVSFVNSEHKTEFKTNIARLNLVKKNLEKH